MTEAQIKALDIRSKFMMISKENETYIPLYLISDMCHTAVELLLQNDFENRNFWNEVHSELIKLNFQN